MRLFNEETWRCKYCNFLYACGRQQGYLVNFWLVCEKYQKIKGKLKVVL